jgi:hypothetical protein
MEHPSSDCACAYTLYLELFWALLARVVYAKGLAAKNEVELCGKIKRKLKEIDVSVV